MPKKFATENPKVTAARDRKAAVKQDVADKKQKAADDAYWADDDKLGNRKLQRKDDDEKKRLEALKRKEENRKLAEEEMSSLGNKKPQAAPKVTRAALHIRKEDEAKIEQEMEEKRKIEAQKIEIAGELEENLNKLEIEEGSARNVEEALKVLGDPKASEDDKHPEKRMRAAYLAFEEKRMPELKIKHPTFRLSQLKQVLKKEWQKSPENPLNARILALSQ